MDFYTNCRKLPPLWLLYQIHRGKNRYGDSKEKTGTEVIFQPNPKYFTDKKIPIDFIFERCKIATALGYKSRLIVDGVEKRISSSIYDLIREESTSISTYVNIPPIEVVSSAKEKLKVAIRYTSDTRDKYFGFTNLLSNYLGGTHVQELEKSVEDAWQIFLNSHKNVHSITFHRGRFPSFYLYCSTT